MRTGAAFLERFRRPAAVPAAASDELDAELLPVLETLDRIEEEARALRASAQAEAERRLDAARAEAARSLERWRRQAEAERVRAERERRAALATEARAIGAEAELEAGRLREQGRARMPELVAAVLACVQERS